MIITVLLVFSILILEYCKPVNQDKTDAFTGSGDAAYVGDKSCQGCHTKEFDLWKQSDHFKAMEPANDSTVLGDFNNVSLTADGITSRFFRKEGKYFINTQGPDGVDQDFEVLYTFGYKPLQQYLVAFPGGKMQVPRMSWDVQKKKWFHQYAGQKIHHNDWLHWTRGGQNWNTMCASCHSTNLQKNYMPDTDSFRTTYSVMTVSCESCHGPAGKHVDFVSSEKYKAGEKVKYSFLKPLDGPNTVQVNTCMPCHARKANISSELLTSTEVMDDMIPEIPSDEFFHADGQVNDEDYIYTSFLQSKMFHRGVKCSNCHDPHSGKKVYTVATQVCLQCHEKKYDSFEHNRHAESLTQVDCVSCHMPDKFYMGNDFRHDHSFRVPRPDLSVKYGTPNACNRCHTNKSSAWASAAVNKWYGTERKYHFADDLIPGSKGGAEAEIHLERLLGDTAVPAIVKATAAHYLGNAPTEKSLALLLNALRENDPQIRYRTVRALGSFPVQRWRDAVGPLLTDKVRAVRIASADLFMQIPSNEVPISFRETFAAAKKELEQYLQYQADFAVGNIMMGDYYLRQSDFFNAEKYYIRGLKKDSMMNYARLNLASLYNQQQKNTEALNVLLEARRTDPKNDRVHYNLALLYVEMKDNVNAEKSFTQAVSLGSRDPRLYYNFALFQQQSGKSAQAEQLLKKGLLSDPSNPDLNYALAYLYVQMGEPQKAMGPAQVLKQRDPGNPDYQALFRSLQIN